LGEIYRSNWLTKLRLVQPFENHATRQIDTMKTIITSLFLLSFTALPVLAQPDEIATAEGTLTLTPILHSTMALEFKGQTIFVDPYGGATKFEGFGNPDLILITDIHGDHLNLETLNELNTENTTFLVPQAVKEKMGDVDAKEIWVIANGEKMAWSDIGVEALPMYNLPESEDSRHIKGRGNGYVLTFADKRLYLSGDTEDIPEMRALKNIDYAFVCMNLPYTMDVNQAADAVLEFGPGVVYPFHYRGGGGKFSDVNAFKTLVNAGDPSIEVRLRDWYVK
jgi:L-ascorbate metabolism protein UlaG (beta-lactamase superfamily)